ncbi:MAG TPA: isoprenylcysteine carboxylmethyltransferase family protein [Pseudonocardiaceae bacterium]|nr:isoprenylcysteine carboxylmethyltransferase family protein [Pseudonocardiaceae bacterium]
MVVLALVLFAAYLVIGVGVRVWVQWRRTGDTGIRSNSFGTNPAARWFVIAGFVGHLAPGVGAPVAQLLGLDPVGVLDHRPLRIAGAVLCGASILALFGAQLAMGDSWRIGVDAGEQTRLVVAGPFRLVRNPIYTGMTVMVVGFVLMVPNVVALVGLPILVVGFQLEVRLSEEPHLRRLHGSAYDEYAARVGRFLPHVRQLVRS